MSNALAEGVALNDTPAISAPFDKEAFIEKHRKSVAADVRRAVAKLKPGKVMELVITPESTVWRCKDKAYTCADIASWDCPAARTLRHMFREEATNQGLNFKFDLRTHPRPDHDGIIRRKPTLVVFLMQP